MNEPTNTNQDNQTDSPQHNEPSGSQLSSIVLIRRYRYMIYGGLLLIVLLTLGNAYYLSKQIQSQVINEASHQGFETMLSLTQTISVSLNHVNKMRDSIETAYQFPQLAAGKQALKFLEQQSQGSPDTAPWENFPPDVKQKIGQLLVESEARDYTVDVAALLTMLPEVVATHKQHDDFQWSYYYDANKVLTQLYPWLSYKDLFAATQTDNMDDAIKVIYEAGGTFPLQLLNPANNPKRQKVWTTPYIDAGGKGMMVSLVSPVYHDDTFIGGVGTDITLNVLDKILTKRPPEIGHLVLVDAQGLVVGDSWGGLAGKTESVTQQAILSLVKVGEAHQAETGTLQRTSAGYWIAYQLQDTPWQLVLEITDDELNRYILSAILPYLIMGALFAALLLFVVLYQHWNFSQPALRLAQFVEELPSKTDLTLPNIPARWLYWFEKAATTEQDRRDYLETIQKQNYELEQRVEERTQELKDALEVLKATQDELVRSEKLSGLGSLVAGVAHELNTPIGNALVVASSLKDFNQSFVESINQGLRRSVLDEYIEQSTESTASIEKSLQRAAELISSFKQVAVDQSSYQRREFNLPEILHELRLTMSPNLSRHSIQLEDKYDQSIAMDSYPGPLTQVLMNLLSNALTHAFSEQTERVVVIECSLLNDQTAQIAVSDNGQGISADNINKVFDPFYTTRLGQGGSGLGLNIVYNLVTGILGGDIKVESEQNEGCCFTLNLPLKAPESAEVSS
ncbi:sensor histidine kinase [Vibrio sp. T187]|uniref:sensor histidine kinase n=1 Tax=Vibrio TaxID=662 RepID=UPI0010CA19F0|nr:MULTISPECIES: ATP-binding protein [Vibrio]MBW3695365.1 sensor histidine kinase [Vibrio sp. T187]